MCYVCGRANCCPSFHSIEEQTRFQPVAELLERAAQLWLEIDMQRASEAESEDEDSDE